MAKKKFLFSIFDFFVGVIVEFAFCVLIILLGFAISFL
jgi:hypothetical protein